MVFFKSVEAAFDRIDGKSQPKIDVLDGKIFVKRAGCSNLHFVQRMFKRQCDICIHQIVVI